MGRRIQLRMRRRAVLRISRGRLGICSLEMRGCRVSILHISLEGRTPSSVREVTSREMQRHSHLRFLLIRRRSREWTKPTFRGGIQKSSVKRVDLRSSTLPLDSLRTFHRYNNRIRVEVDGLLLSER